MGTCGSSKQQVKSVAIGDMRHKIKIMSRSLTATNNNSPDLTEQFTTVYTVWSKIRTVKGEKSFGGTNIENQVTHYFDIRYIAALLNDVVDDYFINYRGEYYKIENIESLDERQRFMTLNCVFRGDDTLPVNEA